MQRQFWPLRWLALGTTLAVLAGCSPQVSQSPPASNNTTQAAAADSSSQPSAEQDVVLGTLESDAPLSDAALGDAPLSDTPASDEPVSDEPVSDESQAANEQVQGQASASGLVKLGSPELTSGIAGEGPLTVEEIQAWLAQPENHQLLEVELPLGLHAAREQINIPADNPLTRAKIELGRQLYFDKRLSIDGTISCASCHDPAEGYTRQTQFGVGIEGLEGNRNSPVSYNRILSDKQFWDGRAESLEDQAVGPIANPIEMGSTHEACVECLEGIEGYRLQFARIFPEEGLTIDTVGKALASFERVIVTGPSPYDYYEPLRVFEQAFAEDLEDMEALKEEDPDLFDQYQELLAASQAHPISESAQRGRALFFSDRSNCTACHAGANFTDEKYHNLGVGMESDDPDLGRFEVTGEDQDRGAFKTPTVRNVALTAPYMHDGSQKTLEEVVEWYDRGGHPNPYLSDKMKKLNLTDQEKQDLVEFMKALTGEFPQVETGRLPQ